MKRSLPSVVVAVMAGVAICNLAGCGGSTETTPPPSITSFAASPATIESGTNSSLTAVFSGGSGVIAPGSIAVTSGTPVSVSPTTTTSYTLTVMATSGGTSATQQATVKVDPVPVISSFTATPATIAAGSSSSLTAEFTGGTGVITPGNITVTSATPVSVSPTATTTYTLTVKPPAGTVNAASLATVTVTGGTVTTVSINPSALGPAVTDQLLGMNLAVWFDIVSNDSAVVSAFNSAGIKAVRWPGGSDSDLYDWSTNTACNGTYTDSNDTFTNFVNDIVVPANLDLALTADYGSDAACTGPGVPSEAAAWVTAALQAGVTVSHMTVGNEEYGSWEADMHTPSSNQHNPTVYASEMMGSTGLAGFYQSIKTASPKTLVGVVVDADNTPGGWDETVLAKAKGYYDFVEYHFYAQAPGSENDTILTQQAALRLTQNINILKQELTAAGEPNTPIYVGEMGSVYSNPGKQSWSITQGLFAGQALAEMMNDGVSRATWWIGFGNCNGRKGNDGSSLYGWQNFGAYNVFSDGSEDPNCPNAGPIGTMSPTAVAFQLFSKVAVHGEHVLAASAAGTVRAYAATHSGGTAVVLFNLNEATTVTVEMSIAGKSSSTDVKQYFYDKSIYDLSQNDVWNGPTTVDLGAQSLPLTLTLTPWSMNVLIIQ